MRNLLISMCVLGSSYVFANCDYGPAGVTCNHDNLDNLSSSGVVILKETTIGKAVNVSGLLDAYATNLYQVDVRGKAKIVASKVDGEFTIKGFLDAEDSNFIGPVLINANEAVFRNSRINNSITISSNAPEPQLLLHGSTLVKGDINFSSGDGEVHLDPGAKIIGKVIGGVVKNNGEKND
jgi:hypothetical protein